VVHWGHLSWRACKPSQKRGTKRPLAQSTNCFGADLHNHNAVGYAKGSLERSFRIARSLLDFYAFTPHSYWHDMPKVSEATFNKFHNGFKTTKERWPDVLRKCAEYYEAGKFVTFPGYEWHSSRYGDYCLIFPYDNAPLKTFSDLESLQKFAREKGIIMIPHHPALRWRAMRRVLGRIVGI